MAKRTNWWLEGWQYEEILGANGSRQRKLVYKGEFYGFALQPKELSRLKLGFITLGLILTAAYIVAFGFSVPSALRLFVGAGMLIVIPLMYLLIGLGYFMTVGLKMPYRGYRGSVVRIRWTSVSIAILSAISVAGVGVGLLINDEPFIGNERWLICMVLVCFCACLLLLTERRFRPQLIPPDLK